MLGLIDQVSENKQDLLNAEHTERQQPDKASHNFAVGEAQRQNLQLLLAACSGDVNTIQALIDTGEIDLESKYSYFPGTALFLAIEQREMEVLQLLLEHGVGVDLQDQRGDSPLHRATSRDSLPAVRILLEHNAGVNTKNPRGQTAWSANIDATSQEG